MEIDPTLKNRVAESGILVYNLEDHLAGPEGQLQEATEVDLAPWLHRGLVLREKPFREAVNAHDWSAYAAQHVGVFCSADAIVPTWAYMLVASRLREHAASVAFGRREEALRDHFTRALATEDWQAYEDRIVVIKGCGSRLVPTGAYVQATTALMGVAKKLMYGEPCSAVPLWRAPKPARPATAAATKTAGVARPALAAPPPSAKR
jgi:hypothetical protein